MEHGILTSETVKSNKLPEIIPEGFEPKWVENLSAEEYHADRSAMSSSGLKLILSKTPLHFHYDWTKGAVDEDDDGVVQVQSIKKSLRIGQICHEAFLEPQKFRERHIIEPEFTGFTQAGVLSARSGEAKQKREAWLAKQPPGALIITAEEVEMITGMASSMLAHKNTSDMLTGSKTEISGWFREPTTGIKCRIRPDMLNEKFQGKEITVLSDFKTARLASPYGFAKQVAELLYHVSLAFYYDGIYHITGRYPDVASFMVVEKTPPFACAVYPLTNADLELGRAWYQHGLEIYKQCLMRDEWPSYQRQAEDIQLPQYAQTRALPMYEFGNENVGF